MGVRIFDGPRCDLAEPRSGRRRARIRLNRAFSENAARRRVPRSSAATCPLAARLRVRGPSSRGEGQIEARIVGRFNANLLATLVLLASDFPLDDAAALRK